MNRIDRITMYERLLDVFLTMAHEGGHIAFAVHNDGDQYVQFRRRGGQVCGEVGSRQWTWPERPLPAAAVSGLAGAHFTGGGRECNYSRDGLSEDAAALAELTDSLLRTAYGLDDEFTPISRELNLNDIAKPRAEPFSRDMVEAHLRSRGAHFLRDEDGDFRMDLCSAGSDAPVVMWLVAEGPDGTGYRVSGLGTGRPVPPTRGEALDRCNDWNRTHRVTKATVLDIDDRWSLVVTAEISLANGVTVPQLADFTDQAVGWILEFWAWIATPAEVESVERERTDEAAM